MTVLEVSFVKAGNKTIDLNLGMEVISLLYHLKGEGKSRLQDGMLGSCGVRNWLVTCMCLFAVSPYPPSQKGSI